HPFTCGHLAPLTNMRTRDVLTYCRQHRERCIREGRWVDPGGVEPPPSPPPQTELDQLWNDFAHQYQADVPDDEDDLPAVLARALAHGSAEIAPGHWFAAETDGHRVPVETHGPHNTVERLLAAVCNREARGGGLGRQIADVEKSAGETPTVLVRSTEFPVNP